MRSFIVFGSALSVAALVLACSSDGDSPSATTPNTDGGLPPDATPDAPTTQPAGWDTSFGLPGIAGTRHPTVYALADLGEKGIAAVGNFDNAGPVAAPSAALWNGTAWTPMNNGLETLVHRLVGTPSGKLYGTTEELSADQSKTQSRLLAWDGQTWTEAAALDGVISSMDIDDSGTLYVAGAFANIRSGGNELPIASVARFDGTTWTALPGAPADLIAVHVERGGSGRVFVGGPIPDVGLHVFDGTNWTPLPFAEGANGWIADIDDEGGQPVIAGSFVLDDESVGGSIARRVGDTWELVGGGLRADLGFGEFGRGDVRDIVVEGTKIYATGLFARAGELVVQNVAAFDTQTSQWSAMKNGIHGNSGGYYLDTLPFGFSLVSAKDGVYVGGGFSISGDKPSVGVAKWDGADWTSLDDAKAIHLGVNGDGVEALAADPAGGVVVGGSFELAGNVRSPGVAHFANGVWSALGAGFEARVLSLAYGDKLLYAGGTFLRSGSVSTPFVAQYDGTAWSPVGEGVDNNVFAVAIGPDKKLYAGGQFSASGATTLHGIASWDGSKWSPLGEGVDGSVLGIAFDEQGHVYAGGDFTHAGANEAVGIAMWDGQAWSPVGEGIVGQVRALTFYDHKLVVGGDFRLPGDPDQGDSPWTNLAVFDGTRFVALGGGTHGGVEGAIGGTSTLGARGNDLYVGGDFYVVGDDQAAPQLTSKFLARWNGATWSTIGAAPTDTVLKVLPTADSLWLGGAFTFIGTTPSNLIGRYDFGTP